MSERARFFQPRACACGKPSRPGGPGRECEEHAKEIDQMFAAKLEGPGDAKEKFRRSSAHLIALDMDVILPKVIERMKALHQVITGWHPTPEDSLSIMVAQGGMYRAALRLQMDPKSAAMLDDLTDVAADAYIEALGLDQLKVKARDA